MHKSNQKNIAVYLETYAWKGGQPDDYMEISAINLKLKGIGGTVLKS